MRAFFVSGVQACQHRGAVSASMRCAVRKPASLAVQSVQDGWRGTQRLAPQASSGGQCTSHGQPRDGADADPIKGARCRDQAHWRLHPRKRTLADVSRPSTM